MKFDKSYYDTLQDYIQNGSKKDLTKDENDYLNMLYMVLGIYRKYGRINAINFLMHKPFECTRRISERMFNESINLFYADDQVTNKAWRNMIFDNLMKASLVLLRSNPSIDSLEIYGKLQMAAAKIKRLDQPDEEKPIKISDKEIKIYSLNPESVGIPAVNRKEVASLIDSLDIKTKDKDKIRQDANIDPINFEEIIDDTKNKTADEE